MPTSTDDRYIPETKNAFIYPFDAYQTNDFMFMEWSNAVTDYLVKRFGRHFPAITSVKPVSLVLCERYTPKNLSFADLYLQRFYRLLQELSFPLDYFTKRFALDPNNWSLIDDSDSFMDDQAIVSGININAWLSRKMDGATSNVEELSRGNQLEGADPTPITFEKVKVSLSKPASLSFYKGADYFFEFHNNYDGKLDKTKLDWLYKEEIYLQSGETVIDLTDLKINSLVASTQELEDEIINNSDNPEFILYSDLESTINKLIELLDKEFPKRMKVLSSIEWEYEYFFKTEGDVSTYTGGLDASLIFNAVTYADRDLEKTSTVYLTSCNSEIEDKGNKPTIVTIDRIREIIEEEEVIEEVPVKELFFSYFNLISNSAFYDGDVLLEYPLEDYPDKNVIYVGNIQEEGFIDVNPYTYEPNRDQDIMEVLNTARIEGTRAVVLPVRSMIPSRVIPIFHESIEGIYCDIPVLTTSDGKLQTVIDGELFSAVYRYRMLPDSRELEPIERVTLKTDGTIDSSDTVFSFLFEGKHTGILSFNLK